MLVMGISGGPFRTHEDSSIVSRFAFHDSAAVLIEDGEVVAAIETERLNRIKHTNKFPAEAIRFCLDRHGARLLDLDRLAYYGEEAGLDRAVDQWNLQRILRSERFHQSGGAKDFLQSLLGEEFGCDFPAERIYFVNHHVAHACSAFYPSGFNESLVLSIDAQGDNESGRVMVGNNLGLQTIASMPVALSLGGFYVTVIKHIGFQQFEEYKAMGLAPCGNASVFRDAFRRFYALLPDGMYTLNWNELSDIGKLCPRRSPGAEFEASHANVAAALQEALEDIVLHMLTHFSRLTGQRKLCIAGGVGHNCSLNGRILGSGLFDAVFVQPAAHDAGCAWGAALSAWREDSIATVPPLQGDIYWGTDIGTDSSIEATLKSWANFIEVTRPPDICRAAAELIAQGSVIGWVQGRSEFGPRALGNRSILADPRPAENKRIINEMVKKRESFRPFAPSVLSEHAAEYFDIPPGNNNLAYMVFVVKVVPEKQSLLGAVTHVDGSARVQTVTRAENPRYCELIAAFRDISGIPILLNTSFNNNAEPIIDSVDDAVVCFLTTKINHLVIGDYLIRKRPDLSSALAEAALSLPPHVVLSKTRRSGGSGQVITSHECRTNFDNTFTMPLSSLIFETLMRSDGQTTVFGLLTAVGAAAQPLYSSCCDELLALWERRLIVLRPLAAATRAQTA